MKQLAIFKDCWADEFDVEAFAVLECGELEKLFSLAEIYFELFPNQELEISFGTNEQLTFGDYKSYRNCFKVHNLDEKEVDVFQKYFPQYLPEYPPEFGTGNRVFSIDIFYDGVFNLYDEGKLPESMIERLKQIEPEFESWINDYGN